MAGISFIFTQKMGNLLADIRKKARLSQNQVAELIGMSGKVGHSYISRLEQGKIQNPFLKTLVLYLDACNTGYITFFAKFSELRFSETHQSVMSQVKLPDNIKIRKKVDRDVALYENSIKFQTKTPIIDYDKLRTKIEQKLTQYLSDHKVEAHLIPIYQTFTSYVIKRVLNPKPNPLLDKKPFINAGVKSILLDSINQMVYRIVLTEEKRLIKRKPLSTEKQKKMAVGFLRYRIIIEQIETEVHKLLNDLLISQPLFYAYKDYCRECYSGMKKYYFKDPSLLIQKLAEITRSWKEAKLDEQVLLKVKDTTFNMFKKLIFESVQK